MNVVEVGKTACASNWDVVKMAVGGGVNFQDEGRKEYVHAKTMHANKTTSPLVLMCTEAVEGIA